MPTVIKVGQTGPVLERLSTVDLADHLAEADAVIAEAKRRAVRIVADAETSAEDIRAETRRRGYETGHAEGFEEGTQTGCQTAYEDAAKSFESRHASVVGAMQGAIAEIDEIKKEIRIAAQEQLLDFAVLIAKKLTFGIGRLNPEAVQGNFSRALRLVERKTDLTVRVHPDDVDSLKTYAEKVLQQAESSPVVSIVEDDSIARGGCRVDNDKTSVDATLETQVDEMVSLLLGDSTR